MGAGRSTLERPPGEELASLREGVAFASLFVHPDRLADHGPLEGRHFLYSDLGRAYDAARSIVEAGGRPMPTTVAERAKIECRDVMRLILEYGQGHLVSLPDFAAEIRRAWHLREIAETAASGADGAESRIRELADMTLRDEATAPTLRAIDLGQRVLARIEALANGGAAAAVTTGLKSLDRALRCGGYRRGCLYIVAGRPGMGKSVVAVSSARAVARAGHGVGFLSLELVEEEFGARLLADQIRADGSIVGYSDILAGNLDAEGRWFVEDAAARIAGLPLIVNCRSSVTVAEARAEAERMAAELERAGKRLDVLFVDYLKFVRATDRYKGQRVYEVGEITSGLRSIAKDLGCCVVLLAQINRSVENRDDKRPTIADLRESGDIENDADAVMFVVREAYYLRRSAKPEDQVRAEELKHRLDLLIEKNRAGPITTLPVWCDVSTSSICDLDRGAET